MENNEYGNIKNQRHVTITKSPCNRDHLYAQINIAALNTARQRLKPAALNMWLYFSQNQNEHSFYLSCVHCCKICNISKTAYHNGFTELISNGYMEDLRGNNMEFVFHDFPKEVYTDKCYT